MTGYQLLERDLNKSIEDLKASIARHTVNANDCYDDLMEFGLESSNYWYNHYVGKIEFCREEIARLQAQLARL